MTPKARSTALTLALLLLVAFGCAPERRLDFAGHAQSLAKSAAQAANFAESVEALRQAGSIDDEAYSLLMRTASDVRLWVDRIHDLTLLAGLGRFSKDSAKTAKSLLKSRLAEASDAIRSRREFMQRLDETRTPAALTRKRLAFEAELRTIQSLFNALAYALEQDFA